MFLKSLHTRADFHAIRILWVGRKAVSNHNLIRNPYDIGNVYHLVAIDVGSRLD